MRTSTRIIIYVLLLLSPCVVKRSVAQEVASKNKSPIQAIGTGLWTRLNIPESEGCAAIVFDSLKPGRILIGTRPSTFFESLDDGKTWKHYPTSIESTLQHGFNNGSVIVHPRKPEWWFAGHEKLGALRSFDSGKTWEVCSTGMTYYSERHGVTLAVDADDDRTLYYGSDRGIFKSTDLGDHWTECTVGLPTGIADGKEGNVTVTSLKVHPRTGAIYAAIYAVGVGEIPGVFRSVDDGSTWKCINHNFDGGPDLEATKALQKALASSKSNINLNLPSKFFVPKGWAFSLAMSKQNPDTILCATSQLAILSHNGGESWNLCTQTWGTRSVAISPTDDKIMAAGGTSSVWLSTDGGAQWNEVTNGIVKPGNREQIGSPHPGHLSFDPAGERLFVLTGIGTWVADVEELKSFLSKPSEP